jgi:hypothetical protein
MRSMILAVATSATLAASALGAQAMPVGSIAGASAAPEVTRIADGCGAYRHMNAAGYCVRNRVYRPYAYYPGYYYRPYARCGIRVGPIGIGGPC